MRRRLEQGSPEQRRRMLLDHVRDQVVRVLGLEPTQPIDPRQGLTDLGMDSLMAVELRNALQASLGEVLPATIGFEHPTIAAIVDYLASDVLGLEDSPPQAETESAPTAPVDSPELDGLSEDEMARLLSEKLAVIRGEARE